MVALYLREFGCGPGLWRIRGVVTRPETTPRKLAQTAHESVT
jgi:hypothetical protein